jgi:hypothetical protein
MRRTGFAATVLVGGALVLTAPVAAQARTITLEARSQQLLQPGQQSTYRQAITGSTGRYAGARGTVTVRQGDGGDRFTFRIRVD